MRKGAAVSTIVLTIGLAGMAVSAETSGKWAKKGSIVFVSRVLQPESGQSKASKNAADAGLPACEPVEVRAVRGGSLKVLWRKDGRTTTTLGEHWDAVVHATKTDCLKVVESRKAK